MSSASTPGSKSKDTGTAADFQQNAPVRAVLRRVSWEGLESPLVPPDGRELVGVTIGNFDGLHLGHQKLFSVLHERLRDRCGGPPGGSEPYPALLTFHPHPRSVLARLKGQGESEFLPVSSLRSKVEAAARNGFRLCVSAHFTKRFAALTPEIFAERFIRGVLSARLVVVGHDWAFGRGRSGSVDVLEALGRKHGFEVLAVAPVEVDGVRVSTTLVREGLLRGDIRTVNRYLGRPYSLAGHVSRGEQRGRLLGFPTANLEPRGVLLPSNGVYAGRALVGGRRLPAVSNLGVRPTFGGGRRILEVHILGGWEPEPGRDLYGERLEFEFENRIREERTFSGTSELTRQIADDIERARAVLGT